MPRSDTMPHPPMHGRARVVAAALLFVCTAGLAYLAGDAIKHEHDLALGLGLGAIGAMLGVAGLSLTVPALPARIGQALRRRPTQLPPIEPTPLADDLLEAAEGIVDATLALDDVTLAALVASTFTMSDAQADELGMCATTARQAVEDAGRWTPALLDMYGSLVDACQPAADAFLATLASDLILWSEWDALTAAYRINNMSPTLPIPVETRFNAAGGRR